MKEREYMLSLYEIYKNLLSDKEKSYFEYYYFEDYSLQEIADNYSVSKSYVGKFITTIEGKLIKFESSLNIYDKNNKIKNILNEITDKNIKSKIEELL